MSSTRPQLLVAIALLVVVGCGEGSSSSSPDVTATATTTATTSDTSAEVEVTASTCLSSTERARVEAIVRGAIGDAAWISSNTHGSGQFASRGWGGAIPFTEAGVLLSASLMQACTAPNEFDVYCQEPDPAATPQLERCSQLACTGDGVLLAKAWIDGLPLTFTTNNGPLEVRVFEAQTVTRELAAGVLELAWTNRLELTFADDVALSIETRGADRIDEDAHTITLEVDVVAERWSLLATVAGDTLSTASGAARVGDVEVVTFDETFTWASCDP